MLTPKLTPTRGRISLAGIWDFSVEKKNTDYKKGFTPQKKAAVPASYNDLFVENEIRTCMDGAWYQKKFFMPPAWDSRRIMLYFGSASYKADVYLNGQYLGTHETGYTPFEFIITDTVSHNKENILCVRIEHILSRNTIPQGNLANEGSSGQFSGQFPDVPFDFFPYSGLHRDVYIYSTNKKTYFDIIHAETDVKSFSKKKNDGTGILRINGKVHGSPLKAVIEIRELELKKELFIESGDFKGEIEVPGIELWDIGKPNLYNIIWVWLL